MSSPSRARRVGLLLPDPAVRLPYDFLANQVVLGVRVGFSGILETTSPNFLVGDALLTNVDPTFLDLYEREFRACRAR